MSITKVPYFMLDAPNVVTANVHDFGAISSGTGTPSDPWILDLVAALSSIRGLGVYTSKVVLFNDGYYQTAGGVECMLPWSDHISFRAKTPLATTIQLADASNTFILKWSANLGGVSNNFSIDGIRFDGNNANQTVAAPLVWLEGGADFYNIENCRFSNSKGKGLLIAPNDASPDKSYGSIINLVKNSYVDNDDYGLYVDGTNGVIATVNVIGRGGASYCPGFFYFKNAATVNLRDYHFESQNRATVIAVFENVSGGEVSGNWLQADSVLVDGAFKFIGTTHGMDIHGNRCYIDDNLFAGVFPLYFSSTTYNNTYYSNDFFTSVSEGGLMERNVYDAGNNTCLDHRPYVVRTAENATHHDAQNYELHGPTRTNGNSNQWLKQWLLYSNDLTQAVWIKAAGTSVVYNDTSTASPRYRPSESSYITFGSANGYVYQDAAVSAKAGELWTFGFWAFCSADASQTPGFSASIGDASGAWTGVSVTIDPKTIMVSGKIAPFRKYKVSCVVPQDTITLRAKLFAARANESPRVWGLNLFQGKDAPTIETTSSTVTLAPGGWKTVGILGTGGITTGYFLHASTSGHVHVEGSIAANQAINLTDNATIHLYSDGLPGMWVRLKIKQAAAGGKAVSFGSGGGVIYTSGGDYTLTATANAVDILSFMWDGTSWWEMSRSQDVKQQRAKYDKATPEV